MRVVFHGPAGVEVALDGDLGQSVMAVATQHGLEGIVGECGGWAACATCHVYVEHPDIEQMEPIDELEDAMLEGTACERAANSRLACQLELSESLAGLRVRLPTRQL